MGTILGPENGYQAHSAGPENVPGVLIKTIQHILLGPGPCPGPIQCEYTIKPVRS